MTKLLEGKVALVTGGANGIGKATVKAMTEAGAKVVIGDIDIIGGESLAREMRMKGKKVIFHPANITLERDLNSLIKRTVREFGRLDIAFNNACVDGIFFSLADQPASQVAQIIDVNIYGLWLSMRYEIRQMLKNHGGAIVNSNCIYGLEGHPGLSIYVASKHAVVGMTKSAALEYAQQKIRINAIAPSYVNKSLYPMINQEHLNGTAEAISMEKIATYREVANTVVWLCSDLSSLVTGHTLPLEGQFFDNS